MNRFSKIVTLAILMCCGSLLADDPVQPEYLTPPNVEVDINSVDLLSGLFEPELPVLSVPAAPRLSFKHLREYVIRVEGTIFNTPIQEPDGSNEEGTDAPTSGVASPIYDMTYGGNTSERVNCFDGVCESEENYGSIIIGGINGTNTTINYHQGQSGTTYVYNSTEIYQNLGGTSDIAEKGSWWVDQIIYADGEMLTFEYDTATCVPNPSLGQECPNYTYYPHRPKTVTSNTGYELRFTYETDDWGYYDPDWYELSTAAIYKSASSTGGKSGGTGTLLAQFTYAPVGNEVSVTDLGGRVWKYSGFSNTPGVGPATAATNNFTLKLPGNTFNTVAVTHYPAGHAAHGLVATVTRNGLTYTYTYNNVVNLGTKKYFYDLTITGPDGYSRTLDLNFWDSGLSRQPYIVADTNSVGQTTSYSYEQRRIKTITYPEGNQVEYFYDTKGNVTHKKFHPKSGIDTIDLFATYPSACSEAQCFKPITLTDGIGKVTTTSFALHGGLLTSTGPADSNGDRRKIINDWDTDPNRVLERIVSTTECFADECNQSNNSDVRITEYTYWGDTHLPLTVTTHYGENNPGSTVTYTYDDAGRVKSVDGPLPGTGDAVYNRYDITGRKTWEIGPNNENNRRVATRYTSLRPQDSQPLTIDVGTISSSTSTSLSIDTTQTFEYTSHGLQDKVRTKVGTTTYQLTQYTYDARNRVQCEARRMNPSRFSSPVASACSLDTTGVYGSDRITRYEYDAASRTKKVTSGYGTSAQGVDIEMMYTPNGQVWKRIDGKGNTTEYDYDEHDRLVKTTFPDFRYEIFDYDENGNLLFLMKRDYSLFSYTYDVSNQLKTKTEPGNIVTEFVYDGIGRTRRITRGTDWTDYDFDNRGFLDRSETNGYEVTYDHDVAGRMTSMTYPHNQVISYGYDDSGSVLSVTAQSGVGSLLVAAYDYDNMGRLDEVLLGNGDSTQYGYDAIGRLNLHDHVGANQTTFNHNPVSQITSRSVTNPGRQTAMPTTSPTDYTVNGMNQYTLADNNPLSYDFKGNLTGYDGWTYGYDAHDRLDSASKSGTTVALDYDPTGRLMSSTLNGGTTDYVYSGAQLIGEYTASGNPINLYVYAPGSGIPIAQFSGTNGLNDMQYLKTDERGSIVAIVDQFGQTETLQYDAYGVELTGSDSLFQYTGQIQIRGTDLYHYKARAYHPELGRFLQTDPIGYDDGMNMYAYVGNDPVNGVDPSGTARLAAGKFINSKQLSGHLYKWAGDAYKDLDELKQDIIAAGQAIQQITEFFADNPNGTYALTEGELNSIMAADAAIVKLDDFLKGGWKNMNLRKFQIELKSADGTFWAQPLREAQFSVPDSHPMAGVYTGSDINYYYLGFVTAAAGRSQLVTNVYVQGHNVIQAYERKGMRDLKQIWPGMRWATYGNVFYSRLFRQ